MVRTLTTLPLYFCFGMIYTKNMDIIIIGFLIGTVAMGGIWLIGELFDIYYSKDRP